MRGSLFQRRDQQHAAGIIPAHAGLTYPVRCISVRHGDHPRACGAHFIRAFPMPENLGSSPRMRGSLWMLHWNPYRKGIIPAHAGLTAREGVTSRVARDHPRACGAHCNLEPAIMTARGSACGAHPVLQTSIASVQGSSPRMRGSLCDIVWVVFMAGIIPAHAGLTLCQCRQKDTAEDHPRACGAHRSVVNVLICVLGSSPRMRGSPQGPST